MIDIIIVLGGIGMIMLLYTYFVDKMIERVYKIKCEWNHRVYTAKIHLINTGRFEDEEKYTYEEMTNSIRGMTVWIWNPINWIRSPIIDKEIYNYVETIYSEASHD